MIAPALGRTDRWYLERTLPDPRSTSEWWFERRLTDEFGWGPDNLGPPLRTGRWAKEPRRRPRGR